MYGLARDLKEALLGRQPKVFHLFSFPLFYFHFSVFCMTLFPFKSLHAFYFSFKGDVRSKHGGGILCINKQLKKTSNDELLDACPS